MGLELRHIPALKLRRGATLIIADNAQSPFLNIQRSSQGPTIIKQPKKPPPDLVKQPVWVQGRMGARLQGMPVTCCSPTDKALHLSQGAHTSLLSHLPRSLIPETDVKHPLWMGLSQLAQVACLGGTLWASDSDPNVNSTCLIQPVTLNFSGSSHVKHPPPQSRLNSISLEDICTQ